MYGSESVSLFAYAIFPSVTTVKCYRICKTLGLVIIYQRGTLDLFLKPFYYRVVHILQKAVTFLYESICVSFQYASMVSVSVDMYICKITSGLCIILKFNQENVCVISFLPLKLIYLAEKWIM